MTRLLVALTAVLAVLGTSTRAVSGENERSPWVVAGVATALYGGAIALTYATRESDGGRGLATGAGVVGGAAVGMTAFGIAALTYDIPGSGDKVHIGPLLIAAGLAGGFVGGLAAYAAASTPGARAPTTAGGLAFPYLVTLVLAFD